MKKTWGLSGSFGSAHGQERRKKKNQKESRENILVYPYTVIDTLLTLLIQYLVSHIAMSFLSMIS